MLAGGNGASLITAEEQAAYPPAPPGYLPYRFTVGFRPDALAGASPAEGLPQSLLYQHPGPAQLAREIAADYGLKLVQEAYFGSVNFATFETAGNVDAGMTMARIAVDHAESISYLEYDGVMQTAYTPNDPYYPDDLWGLVKINAGSAWDTQLGDGDILLAVVDGGVRYSGDTEGNAPDHEDLASICLHPPDYWPDETFDLHDDDNVPEDETTIGHGSRVMGIAAAAGNNARGVVGIGFGVTAVPIRVSDASGQTTTSTLAAGITLANAIDADVANVSIAGVGSTTLKNACDQAWEDGLLLVAAAGNDNVSGPYYPGSYESVINVGATDQDDDRASFSNYGSSIDIAAPGLAINSTTNSSTTAYNSDWGTSYSSPLVAGTAALLLSYDPTLSVEELRGALVNTGPLLPGGQWSNSSVRRLAADAALQWIVDEPPQITITSPEEDSYVSGDTAFTALVTDNSAVALVELYIDGELKASFDSGGPYEYTWVTTDYHGGPYELSVYAEDDNGTFSTEDTTVTVRNQQLDSVDPPAAARGAAVSVEGSYFLADGSDTYDPFIDHLYFTASDGWVRATVSSWTQTEIEATVPAQAIRGPLMVSIDGAEVESGFDFYIPPAITSIVPDTQVVGGVVSIYGTDFGATQGPEDKVAIGDSEAAVTSWSDQVIDITVPAGVVQSELVVTTPGGPSNGVQFTPKPEITLIHPWPAWHGGEVTIIGTSFGATQGDSTLELGGGVLVGSTDITSWSDTEIDATVPATAQSGDVVVTVNSVASEGYYLRIGLPPPQITDLDQL